MREEGGERERESEKRERERRESGNVKRNQQGERIVSSI